MGLISPGILLSTLRIHLIWFAHSIIDNIPSLGSAKREEDLEEKKVVL